MIDRDVRLSSNERIHVLVDKVRIGMEVRYNLEETTKLQRLFGRVSAVLGLSGRRII